MIEVIKGNLLTAQVNIIAHQVNCKGVMGAGIAKQIKTMYPNTFQQYTQLCNKRPSQLLGHNLYTAESNKLGRIIVANMFAQESYGRNSIHTNYDALKSCLRKLNKAANDLASRGLPHKIGMPYHIGCGLGGGDWSVVMPIIEKELDEFEVFLYHL